MRENSENKEDGKGKVDGEDEENGEGEKDSSHIQEKSHGIIVLFQRLSYPLRHKAEQPGPEDYGLHAVEGKPVDFG